MMRKLPMDNSEQESYGLEPTSPINWIVPTEHSVYNLMWHGGFGLVKLFGEATKDSSDNRTAEF